MANRKFDPLRYTGGNHKYAAKLMGIDELARIRIRARLLISELNVYILDGSDLCMVWAKEVANELVDLLMSYKQKSDKPKNDIDDEMILQARMYPIQNLIPFQHGKALAFCHEDSKPSLSWYKQGNAARCFVCDKTFNPITVLMERDGMTFSQAVKELC